jgi:hypothetical protein
MNFRKILAFAVALASLATPVRLFADDIPSTVGAAILGKGWDSHDQAYRGDCLAYDPKTVLYVGGAGATSSFSRSLTQTEMQDSLGFSAQGRAQFGVVKTSLAASFAKEATADDYSETTTYQAIYNFKNAYLNSDTLNGFAQQLKGNGTFIPTAFKISCGDQYVKQVKLGAALYFSFKISFSTREQKDRFTTSFSIEGPLSGLSGSLDKAHREFGQSASIQISALQIGGRVDRLSTIFANGSTEGQAGAVHAILLCSMSNLTPCQQVITKALDYATNPTDPDAFPQQISPTFDPSKPGGPAELGYVTEPWSNIGLQVPPAVVADVIEAERGRLPGFLALQLKYRARLDDLKLRTFRLSPNQITIVNTDSGIVDNNLLAIAATATTCYVDDEKCPQAVTQLSSNIAATSFDPGKLDIQPENFAQWCDYSGYTTPSVVPPTPSLKATRATVDALIKIARLAGVNTQNDDEWAKVADQCDYSQKLLVQLPRLGLSGLTLTDLRPLAQFDSMRFLDLSNNSFDDQALANGQIGSFASLLSLNLAGNSLQNTQILASLKNLRALDVSSNHILDVQPLAILPDLLVLKATGNPLVCKDAVKCCPLSSVNGVCKF